MKKEPFVIDISATQLPNLADNSQKDFGYEFSHTDVWQNENGEIIKILGYINEKLDIIIRHIAKNGRD